MDVYSGKSSGNPNKVEKYEFYEELYISYK